MILCQVLELQEQVYNPGIVVNYNNTYMYNTEYQIELNNSVEYILDFSLDHDSADTPARISVSSEEADASLPIFITARQERGVLSWQLPMIITVQGRVESFSSISRTLCPHTNVFHEQKTWCDDFTNKQKSPIIHISTSSPMNVTLTIEVETVDDFLVSLDTEHNFTITPSSPKYYFYSFEYGANNVGLDLVTINARKKFVCQQPLSEEERRKLELFLMHSDPKIADEMHYELPQQPMRMPPQNSGLFSPKSVLVLIESDNDVCAIVSIQNYTCPVFDNEREILYDGYYLTMMRRGGITLNQNMYPDGFYIVFIVKSSDEDCIDDQSNSLNASVADTVSVFLGWDDGMQPVVVEGPAGRSKTFTFKVLPTISYVEYLVAATTAFAFFMFLYVLFVTVIMCCRPRTVIVVQSPDVIEAGEQYLTDEAHHYTEPSTSSASRRRHVAPQSSQETVAPASSAAELLANGENQPRSPDSEDTNITFTDSQLPNYATVTSHYNSADNSSSDSDDSEYQTLRDGTTNQQSLPAKLCLADLARKRGAVLTARSNLYLWHLLTVSVFYSLPVVQLVIAYQVMVRTTGNQDLCYYNFLCAHPLGVLSDFNHVYSNLGYVLLGLLFLALVGRRQRMQKARANDNECGIPQHYGLFYAMGCALIMEGILSASYHVCPNHMNFQFDTSFMYVMAVLCMVKIYQTRHPDINAKAHATFGVLACMIFIVLYGVLQPSIYYWAVFTVLHIVTCIFLTFKIYYMGRFRLDRGIYGRVWTEVRTSPKHAFKPMYAGRMVFLILANLVNWLFAGYGMYMRSKDFASHMLVILMGNTLLYTFFYIVMKLLHREKIALHSWMFILLAHVAWFSSTYFFLSASTKWSVTPAESRLYNQQCKILDFYDNHDIWHFLSAIAMFMSFNILLTLDDGLSKTPRKNIKVF